jgi:hypothetical protein
MAEASPWYADPLGWTRLSYYAEALDEIESKACVKLDFLGEHLSGPQQG